MNAITQKPAIGGQIKQIIRFGADAIEKVLGELGLSNTGAQRVIENGDEFASAIRNAVLTSLNDLSRTDKYEYEEVESSFGYRSGHTPKPLAEQFTRLKELYPQLKDVEVPEQGELPAGAEGWFAVPNVWKEDSLLTGTYNDSVVQMLERFKKDCGGNFHDYCEGLLGTDRLRESARAKATWKKISADQGHSDILVIAAQFGITHRGRSVRRAREVMVDQNQFELGAFTVGIMLLTHPDRLKHCNDLWIDCAGDEFDEIGTGVRFGYAPYFRFHDAEVRLGTTHLGYTAEVRFGTKHVGYPQSVCGSASGVLP